MHNLSLIWVKINMTHNALKMNEETMPIRLLHTVDFRACRALLCLQHFEIQHTQMVVPRGFRFKMCLKRSLLEQNLGRSTIVDQETSLDTKQSSPKLPLGSMCATSG